MSTRDLLQFAQEAIKNKGYPHKEVYIDRVAEEAKDRLNKKFGIDVDDIVTDTGSVWHAYKKSAHNLEKDDIIHAVEVINTSTDIEPSGEHQNNPTFIFKKDIDGEISFLVEARIKNKKLLVANFWRKKKKRRHPDASS